MKTSSKQKTGEVKTRRVVLSIAQILAGTKPNSTPSNKRKKETSKRKKPLKPILPPKSMVVLLKDKPEKSVYHRRILDYKHCGLLQRYIGLGGKILPRRQTRLTAKQQRYVARTIKTARIMGLLPFTNKERAFFRSFIPLDYRSFWSFCPFLPLRYLPVFPSLRYNYVRLTMVPK